ncbi:molybdopterin-dependent oxidoreductase [Tepidicella baoligensis]|uniref:molybdopterin-dependent oxidoreductase n=1 Tax=Tepidicella baoligensis TaxID=2707016 RepID=UPI0015D9F41F|nr:molybdopterin-dependent oxidoreductase [Tepidicella baoligensis]
MFLPLLFSPSVGVQALEIPRQTPVLTLTGLIGVTNQTGAAVFDMAMLEALPQHEFTTLTPWEDRPLKFSGPLLRDVLRLVQARGQTLRATALNDYRISIPADDAQQFDVIIATRLNDQPMSIRTRGPLFIIYPFNAHPQLQSARYYERSIWQLKAIHIE